MSNVLVLSGEASNRGGLLILEGLLLWGRGFSRQNHFENSVLYPAPEPTKRFCKTPFFSEYSLYLCRSPFHHKNHILMN